MLHCNNSALIKILLAHPLSVMVCNNDEGYVQGKIDCFVIKEPSRLGRDASEVEFYVQHLFPEKGICFLFVIDDFDALDGITDISSGAAP